MFGSHFPIQLVGGLLSIPLIFGAACGNKEKTTQEEPATDSAIGTPGQVVSRAQPTFQPGSGVVASPSISKQKASSGSTPPISTTIDANVEPISQELLLTLNIPTSLPYYVNTPDFTLSGTCSVPSQIILSGDILSQEVSQPDHLLQLDCHEGVFSFLIAKAEGSFAVLITASDGTDAVTREVRIIADRTSPEAPTVTTPAILPYTSGNQNLVIAGACEDGAVVNLSGAAMSSMNCTNGTYSFDANASAPGTFVFTLIQTDLTGNQSVDKSIQWTYSTAVPVSPSVSSPAVNPFTDRNPTLILSGSCTSGDTLILDGDVATADIQDGNLQKPCTSSSFSYTIQKSVDGVYSLQIAQKNELNGLVSTPISFTWKLDMTAPIPPNITTPSTPLLTSMGPLTISGNCEPLANVVMSGDHIASQTCNAQEQFSFSFDETADGSFTYVLTQTDTVGNISQPVNLQWVRDSQIPAAPAIVSPTVEPYLSNEAILSLSGLCSGDTLVKLSGDVTAEETAAASLTQTCNAGKFAFLIDKSANIEDQTYVILISQIDYKGTQSSASKVTWKRDITAPELALDAQPTNPNLIATASFSFSSSDPQAIFECKLDSSNWSACISPKQYLDLPNGEHIFSVRAHDQAGNNSTIASTLWVQGTYNSLALFHFNSSAPTQDSSFLGASNLTNYGATSAPGKFNESLSFNGTSNYLSMSHQPLFTNLSDRMTLEMWINVAALDKNTYMVLASKGIPGNYEFRLSLARKGGSPNLVLSFDGSLDGNTYQSVSSANFSGITSTWAHLAVVWNRGSVAFYVNGNATGSAALGIAGSASLHPSSAPLLIGIDDLNSNFFKGLMDEVRISQTARYQSPFTPANAAFIAD